MQFWADVQNNKSWSFSPQTLCGLVFIFVFVQTVPPFSQERTKYLNGLQMQVTLQDTHQQGWLFKVASVKGDFSFI